MFHQGIQDQQVRSFFFEYTYHKYIQISQSHTSKHQSWCLLWRVVFFILFRLMWCRWKPMNLHLGFAPKLLLQAALALSPSPSSTSLTPMTSMDGSCWNDDGSSKTHCCNWAHGNQGLSSCWSPESGRTFERCCTRDEIFRRKTTDEGASHTAHLYGGLDSTWPFYYGQVQKYYNQFLHGDLSAFAPCSMKELRSAVSCWLGKLHDVQTFEACCLSMPPVMHAGTTSAVTCGVKELCCRCFPTLLNATWLTQRVEDEK